MMNAFDSVEKQECIEEILCKEIDFKQLIATNVIVCHFSLHKRRP